MGWPLVVARAADSSVCARLTCCTGADMQHLCSTRAWFIPAWE